VELEPGMITTIEPGIYLNDQFGIRLENVVLVVEDDKNSTEDSTFYKFETLTLCPIDLNLVKKGMLKLEEIDWLNSYHKKVRKRLSPLLNKGEREWLYRTTQPI
jgi:Xaa-Pro aminopeptidase